MLADEDEVVIGVGTHRDAHSLGALVAPTGAVIYESRLAADADGHRQALQQVAAHVPGRRAWALEGSGAYGAGLVRFLLARSERVIEIDRPERRAERTQARSDPLDAVRAARTAMARAKLASPWTPTRLDKRPLPPCAPWPGGRWPPTGRQPSTSATSPPGSGRSAPSRWPSPGSARSAPPSC
jgi:hypothetical protein